MPQARSPARLDDEDVSFLDEAADERPVRGGARVGVGLEDVGERLPEAVREEERGERERGGRPARGRGDREADEARGARDGQEVRARRDEERAPEAGVGGPEARRRPGGSGDGGHGAGGVMTAPPARRRGRRRRRPSPRNPCRAATRASVSAVRSSSSSVCRAFTVKRRRQESAGTAGVGDAPAADAGVVELAPGAEERRLGPDPDRDDRGPGGERRDAERLERGGEPARVPAEALARGGVLVHEPERLGDGRQTAAGSEAVKTADRAKKRR